MTEEINKGIDSEQDSLVVALESIKTLLAKSDSKLAAARESIAIASNQTSLGKAAIKVPEQIEIPVLDDIVILGEAGEIESVAQAVSNISEQLSEKIDETLAMVNETIPVLEPKPVIIKKHDPRMTLAYLNTLEESLKKTLHHFLVNSIASIEINLKNSVSIEIKKIRDQIEKEMK